MVQPKHRRARVMRGAAWLLGGNLSSQALRLLSNLILTRLLLPEAFGLVAAVNTLYFGLVMFSDLGVWQSVVKSGRGTEARFLGTAWSIQLLRGLVLCAVVLAIAAGVHQAAQLHYFQAGTVYADPKLPPLIAAFSVCALLQGMESMKLACAQRALQLGELSRLEIMSQLLAMSVTLPLAWATHSVWSLLIGTVLSSAARTVLSHRYLAGPSCRPCWDASAAMEILGFGKWIFVSSVIGFLAAHGEKLILGALLATTSFGVYAIAATLILALMGVYGSLNAHLIFSTLSEALRSDARTAERVYFRGQQIADACLGLLAGTLFMSGHWLIAVLYDARYQDAGWMLQWLGLGLLAVRHQVLEQLMFARGQPGWVSASNLVRALSLWALIPAGFSLAGERGAIVAVVLSQFASWPVSLAFKYRNGLLTTASERVWLPALLAGALLGWVFNWVVTLVLK